MKRRLRKKKHLGEFSVFGFHVKFLFRQEVSCYKNDKFFDDFIDEIEKNIGHCGGGGTKDNLSFFCVVDYYPPGVCKSAATRKQHVESRRSVAMDWWPLFYLPQLQKDGNILDEYGLIRIDFGEVKDAWYGEFDDEDQENYTTFLAETDSGMGRQRDMGPGGDGSKANSASPEEI